MNAWIRSTKPKLGMRPDLRSPTKLGSFTASLPKALADIPDLVRNASISERKASAWDMPSTYIGYFLDYNRKFPIGLRCRIFPTVA